MGVNIGFFFGESEALEQELREYLQNDKLRKLYIITPAIGDSIANLIPLSFRKRGYKIMLIVNRKEARRKYNRDVLIKLKKTFGNKILIRQQEEYYYTVIVGEGVKGYRFLITFGTYLLKYFWREKLVIVTFSDREEDVEAMKGIFNKIWEKSRKIILRT